MADSFINPFDSGGFDLVSMTRGILDIPNQYGRVNKMRLFNVEGITERSVAVEYMRGELRLLSSKPLGAPASVGDSDERVLRTFGVPHIPHNDVILPSDVIGIRAFGQASGQEALSTLMARKLTRMRARHAQTLEYMRVNALMGITKDGNGKTLYNWHKEFDVTKKTEAFNFSSDSADMVNHCREVSRHIEDNLNGETMTSVHALVSPTFFDKLIAHKSVKEAYKYFQAAQGGNPLRDDVRTAFKFGGILFEEYLGTVTLANGTAAKLIPDGEGIAFPLGTMDTFTTYYAPANLMECVGTAGEEVYARQLLRLDGTGIDIFTESNPLPMGKRPALTVQLK